MISHLQYSQVRLIRSHESRTGLPTQQNHTSSVVITLGFWFWHLLQVCRRSQFTFPHAVHVQSAFLNSPSGPRKSLPSFFGSGFPPPPAGGGGAPAPRPAGGRPKLASSSAIPSMAMPPPPLPLPRPLPLPPLPTTPLGTAGEEAEAAAAGSYGTSGLSSILSCLRTTAASTPCLAAAASCCGRCGRSKKVVLHLAAHVNLTRLGGQASCDRQRNDVRPGLFQGRELGCKWQRNPHSSATRSCVALSLSLESRGGVSIIF